VAYTEGRWQKSTDDRKADLWVVPTDKDNKTGSKKLTFDRAGYRSPQWSNDSSHIYALASRKTEGEKNPPLNGTAQIWRLSPQGEIVPVTRVDGGVEAYEICRHANALLYLVHVDHQVDDDFKALREKFAKIDYGQGVHKTSQIWKLNLSSFRAEKLI